MKSNLNIKIIGTNTEALFLSLFLARLNVKITIDEINPSGKTLYDNLYFTFTNSTKSILEKLNLWNKLENKVLGYTSLSIFDKFNNKEIIFSNNDSFLKKRSISFIGWAIKYSDLKDALFNEVSTFKNVSFSNKENKKSYYNEHLSKSQFYFRNNYANTIKKFLFLKNENYTSCISFKVSIRGYTRNRAYQIFLDDGYLLLIPLRNNIYQVHWSSKIIKAKHRINLNSNFLLDNLSTLLPKEIKLDQMIGDIKLNPALIKDNYEICFYKNIIYFDNYKEFLNPLIGRQFKSVLINLNKFYSNPKYKKELNLNFLKNFKYKYFLNTFLNLISLDFYLEKLFFLIINNNFISKFFKRLIYLFLNKFFILNTFLKNIILKIVFKNLIK